MRYIRTLWFGIIFLLVVYITAVHFSELQNIIALFKKARPLWVLAAVILQIGTYFSAGLAYRDILSALGFKIRLKILTKLYLAMTFLTHILPVGAFSGTVYFTSVLNRLGVQKGQGAAASILGLFTGYLAFFFLLIGLMLYFPMAKITTQVPFVEIILVLGVIIVMFIVVDRLVVHRGKLYRIFEDVFRIFHAQKKWEKYSARFETFMAELGEGRALFFASWKKFIAPMFYQLAILVLDALTILLIFFAFGERASFAVILVSYTLARFIGAISFLPGGLGSFEAVQILIMKVLGIPLASAALVTLFFRLFSFWLPTPIGFYFYRHLQKEQTNSIIN